MEVTKEFVLENLTNESVAVVENQFIDLDGVKTQIKSNRLVYCNCNHDRTRLEEILPSNCFAAIVAMWGDKATINDLPVGH